MKLVLLQTFVVRTCVISTIYLCIFEELTKRFKK